MSKFSSLALLLSGILTTTNVLAQDAMNHDDHHAHGQDHGPMHHDQEEQGHQQHQQHQHHQAPPTGVVPELTDQDRSAAFIDSPGHTVHDQAISYYVLLDRLEWQDADEGTGFHWDLDGWVGGDINRLWLRSEGQRTDGVTEEAELQLLYGHAISPWWDLVVGARQDFEPSSPQTWAAIGVQGMPLYALELEATAYVGEGGQTAVGLEAEYDILFTNRLKLQPVLELDLHGRNDPQRGIGAGLSSSEFGLRLRYEVLREFAPYVGMTWQRLHGNTANLARAANEDRHEARWVAGVRFWF